MADGLPGFFGTPVSVMVIVCLDPETGVETVPIQCPYSMGIPATALFTENTRHRIVFAEVKCQNI